MRVLAVLLALSAVLVACAAPANGTPAGATLPEPTTTAVPTTASSEPARTPAPPAPASSNGNADVTFVRAVLGSDGAWRFHVTVSHPDTGWDDYADGWDVVLPNGTVVKPDPESGFTRLLTHPHVDEQPFTRSQAGIAIPDDVTAVTVRAHDLVDGWGGRTVTVDLTADGGEDYTIERP